MGEIRTLIVGSELLDMCEAIHVRPRDYEVLHEVEEQLPSALSPEEIDSLGFQIANHVNAKNADTWGGSRGRKVEIDVLATLGASAIIKGDFITGENVIDHLKHVRPFNIPNRVVAFVLKRELNARRSQK